MLTRLAVVIQLRLASYGNDGLCAADLRQRLTGVLEIRRAVIGRAGGSLEYAPGAFRTGSNEHV